MTDISRDNESKVCSSLVKELFKYDEKTGKLTLSVSKGKVKDGDIAGTIDATGYLTVCINYVHYKAHRIVWLWMTGNWPDNCIDHINGNRGDNTWSNLRDVSVTENRKNTMINSNNISGIKRSVL